jgi:hypothetical protein
MKYAVGMGSGAMIYIPSFMRIGSGIRKLIEEYTHTDTDSRVISQTYIYFFKIRNVG